MLSVAHICFNIRYEHQDKVPRDFPGYPGDLRFYIGFNRTSIGYYMNYTGFDMFEIGRCMIPDPGDLVLNGPFI